MNFRRRRERPINDFLLWRELLEEEEEDEEGFLNPPRRTYYLGRGRHGDNSRLHRGRVVRLEE